MENIPEIITLEGNVALIKSLEKNKEFDEAIALFNKLKENTDKAYFALCRKRNIYQSLKKYGDKIAIPTKKEVIA